MIGIWNLWLPFVLLFAIFWAAMTWASRKRGKPIEGPEIYEFVGKNRSFLLGYLPFIMTIIGSIFVPIRFGTTLFWIGLLVYILGFVSIIIAIYSFAKFKGGVNTTRIYRYSRNPMCVGEFLFILGLNLMGWSISLANIIFVILSILWVATTHWWILQEEAFLQSKYGNSFREYMNRVPRYIGILKTNKNEKEAGR